ncbi:hypothetical protein ACFQI3_11615 [Hansschlegelia quercus]|uniref:Uncharacterized protein n=1 Tax=Hansschlegelia quercus TaxID=2528245 RepID=A0A4Q9GHH1_9HYPH|nr:hypothetical protein [Hansschlegelia quercus]TBN53492.1 hypothetical protein EYR15_10820 [Hansschlegelia quercus]
MTATRAKLGAASVVVIMACGSGSGVRAGIQQQFQGSWVADSFECRDVFITKAGKTLFRSKHDNTLPGFVVEGSRIRGKTASCSLISIKQTSNGYVAALNCKSQIMFGAMSVSLRLKDQDTIERYDPSFPEMRETYHRCVD